MLPDRIELSTSPLPMECSTTELRQRARYRGESVQMAAHQAAGSCHKGPAGASTRAGLNGPKIVKNCHLLPAGSFEAVDLGQIGFPTVCGRCPGAESQLRTALQRRRLRRGAARASMFGGRVVGGAAPGSIEAYRRTDDDGRSRQGCRKKRRGGEGFATGPAQAGVARKSQAAEVAGPRAPRARSTFRKRRCLPK